MPGAGALIFALYPVWVRCETYLAARQGSQAAVEFQKILSHPGIVLNEPIGALARLGLARAYAVAPGVGAGISAAGGNASVGAGRAPPRATQRSPLQQTALAEARRAYQGFFALWKDADPDIPVLQQAKTEYARLR